MRVFVANEDVHSQRTLYHILAQELEADIVGETDTIESLLPKARATQPDLVLLDWEIPGHPSAYLVGALHALASRPKVVALSTWPVTKNTALAAGADDFICKKESQRHFLAILGNLRGNDKRKTAIQFS